MKKTSVNLLEGPILRAMIAFAIPIMIANIFQQLYNTVDIMIVGRFLGEESLAAVGATAAIFELVVGFALGIGNGMGIVIARYYGATNMKVLNFGAKKEFVDRYDIQEFLHANHLTDEQIVEDITAVIG